jgi:hypothetical protein
MGIDLLAYGGTCGATGCTTEQRAHQCARQTAEDGSDRAGDHAEGRTGFGTA